MNFSAFEFDILRSQPGTFLLLHHYNLQPSDILNPPRMRRLTPSGDGNQMF